MVGRTMNNDKDGLMTKTLRRKCLWLAAVSPLTIGIVALGQSRSSQIGREVAVPVNGKELFYGSSQYTNSRFFLNTYRAFSVAIESAPCQCVTQSYAEMHAWPFKDGTGTSCLSASGRRTQGCCSSAIRYRVTTVLLKASRGSEQYQSMNSRIAWS